MTSCKYKQLVSSRKTLYASLAFLQLTDERQRAGERRHRRF